MAGGLTRLQATVSGRVQGVGFRWFARETARGLGLSGWVRNCDDGTVRLEAQGEAAALEEFKRLLKAGFPGARVDGFVVSAIEPRADGGSFEIK